MRHLYELPTDSVIVSCFADDVIGRNQDVVSFCSIIDSFNYSTIVALDGSWGSGKTFFIKQTKMLIDKNCNPTSLNADLRERFERAINANPSIIKKMSFTQKHSTVYYDAWENDDETDPVLSIIFSVIKTEQVKQHIKNDRSVLDVVSSIAECITGRSVNTLVDAIKGDNFFDELKKRETINEMMRKFFDAAIGKECTRLVIFIDELDRCKPSYAVLLLERIKHFFDDNRLTFIFSLNREQLQHTIRNFYGNDMDASKYLDKFFDLNMHMPPSNKERFLTKVGLPKTAYIYDEVCYATIAYLNLELREIAKYVQHMKVTIYDEAHEKVYGRNSDFTLSFCMIYLAPILAALRLVAYDKYQEFINGLDHSVFTNIISASEFALGTQPWLLGGNETFSKIGATDTRRIVDFKSRLIEVYDAIFREKYYDRKPIIVGQIPINAYTKEKVLKLIEPISSNIQS